MDNYIKKVHNIINYIMYELQNPIASYQFQIKINHTISILNYFSQAGPIYKNTEYRYLVIKHWIIFYKIERDIIKIYDIFNSKQNPQNFNLS